MSGQIFSQRTSILEQSLIYLHICEEDWEIVPRDEQIWNFVFESSYFFCRMVEIFVDFVSHPSVAPSLPTSHHNTVATIFQVFFTTACYNQYQKNSDFENSNTFSRYFDTSIVMRWLFVFKIVPIKFCLFCVKKMQTSVVFSFSLSNFPSRPQLSRMKSYWK